MLEWLCNFLADEFLVVALPRVLVLRNKRLGALHKLLQLLCLIAAFLYSLYVRTLMLESAVEAWPVQLWREDSPAQAVVGHTLPHCEDPSIYASKIDGHFSYAPTACKALPNEEAHFNHQDKLFLATLIDDVLVWDGMDQECGAASQQKCQQNAAAVYEEADGRCSCKFHEQFIVKNAEEQLVRFAYGNEIDLSHGKYIDLSQGASSNTVVTSFLTAHGTDCMFGGKSQWHHSEVRGGISGTLNELLVCAGVTLDSEPAKLVAGTLSSSPHLRTMGFKLTLHLDLSQDHWGHTTSEVTVRATPMTTLTWKDDVRPTASSRMGTVSRRLRRAHGVAVDVSVTGSMFMFSWYQLVRGLVDVIVLTSIPRFITEFIAMYLMGVSSQIYRHSARTKLSIFGRFHNTVAKLMLAEVAFRGLVSNFSSHIEGLDSLTPQLLVSRLGDVFKECINTGALQGEELSRMACAVFVTMDKNKSGMISCREFIEACTDDGEITMQRMARYFHDDENIHSLRKFLDDTHVVAEKTATNACRLTAQMTRQLELADTCREADVHHDVDTKLDLVFADNRAAHEKQLQNATNVRIDNTAIHKEEQQELKTPHDVRVLECSLANLERRLQAHEEYCKIRFLLLRDTSDQQPSASSHSNCRQCQMFPPQGNQQTASQGVARQVLREPSEKEFAYLSAR